MTFTLGDIGVLVAIVGSLLALSWFILNKAFFRPVKEDIKEIKSDLKQEKEKTAIRREECTAKFTRLENVPTLLSNLNESVLTIKLFLMSKHEDAPGALSITRSPRELSDDGIALYNVSGAREVLEKHIDAYIRKMELSNPKSALDVEELALTTLYGSTDNEEFIPLKNYVYNNPVFKELSITIATICFVMSLPLRNEYLKRHKEINPDG